MIANLDSDLFVYRVGFTTQEESEGIAAYRMDELVDGILTDCETDKYKAFLTSTDHSNFRYALYSGYKANRPPKPIHYLFLREYLISKYNAEVVYGEEADDALGYSQTEETICCSIDKDLLMIPGKHFNFVKKEFYNVSPQEGLYNFYWQLLNGDTADKIPGCPGIGPKSIEKHIHSDMSEEMMFEICLDLYKTQYAKKEIPFDAAEDMLRNGRLLKIKQTKDELLWQFPVGL